MTRLEQFKSLIKPLIVVPKTDRDLSVIYNFCPADMADCTIKGSGAWQGAYPHCADCWNREA